jgi:hypothetical protein
MSSPAWIQARREITNDWLFWLQSKSVCDVSLNESCIVKTAHSNDQCSVQAVTQPTEISNKLKPLPGIDLLRWNDHDYKLYLSGKRLATNTSPHIHYDFFNTTRIVIGFTTCRRLAHFRSTIEALQVLGPIPNRFISNVMII